MAIAHLQPERYWPKVCEALGLDNLVHDSRFDTVEARSKNAGELVAIFDERFATKARGEWLKILSDAGCICTPIQTPTEVVNDPQARANDYFISVDSAATDNLNMVGFPWSFSSTPASCRRTAPEFGQHTGEILVELGYKNEEIEAMKQEGAI
jgi:crotonobetainyl-CoA:carnitine CoA-transferase CaiB-like acyl-CoA transferase